MQRVSLIRDSASLRLSECFSSLQGEGASLGQPCVFVRLAICNLSCSFCDTPYTWDFKRYDKRVEVSHRSINELAQELNAQPLRRIVLTGAEPLLQQEGLQILLKSLDEDFRFEVESNATIAPSEKVKSAIHQWNFSPKLSNSMESLERRWVPEVLEPFLNHSEAYLKWVVGEPAEAEEAIALSDELGWPRSRVFFMPLAADRESHRSMLLPTAELALRYGVRFSPRLHLELWDSKRGV